MRRILTVWLVGLALGQVAHAAPRLSPRVRLVASGALAARTIGDPATPQDDRALVTVRVRGGAAALAKAGFVARTLDGNELVAVRADAGELARLSSLPGVIAIEERRILWPLLDAAGPAVHAPEARQESGLDGTGVLVGVVDTGVDVRHADLRSSDGKTRIAALLDLSESDDRHPELAQFGGAVWTESEIDAALAAEAAGMMPAVPVGEKDVNGHGTHVSAIAISNGLATARGLPAGRYVGMAPAAELISVQATHGGSAFTDVDVLDGCRFAVFEAGALSRPLALNLSLGGPGGAHDGSTNLEQGLDALFPADQPGRVLVVAAGNDGLRDLHAGGFGADGEVLVPLDTSMAQTADGTIAIELWYAGALSISVETPGGFRSPKVSPGKSGTANSPKEGQILVDDASNGPRSDGLSSASITLVGPAGASPPEGTWKIRLDGKAARWDAWILDAPPTASFPRFTDHVSEDDRLDLPATAHDAITVGSFISRNQWTTVDGKLISRPIELGVPSSFSSPGPTSDGRFAPDLLAPGEFVAAALSVDAPPDQPTSAFFVDGSPTFAWADDGLHGILRGTSQAAPMVAGAAALLLQADPTLTGNAIREILRATARPLEGSLGYSPRTGFGALDLLAAVRYQRGLRGQAVSASLSTVGVSRDALPPGDEETRVTVTPRDGSGAPLGPGRAVSIDLPLDDGTSDAPAGPVLDAGFGRYERDFFAHARLGAVGTVLATVDGVALAERPQVFFVEDRSEIGRTLGGGCATSGSRSEERGLILLLFALALAGGGWLRNSRRRLGRSTLDR
ncbi:MAG TPA: S8 family serine peptidase [Polyangia bacterium]